MISDFSAVAVGGETWFARSLATVAEDLRDCRPTVFFAVPRVWEKLQEAVVAKLGEEHGLKKLIADSYVELGEHVVDEYHDVAQSPRLGEAAVRGARRGGRQPRSATSSASTKPTPGHRGRSDPPRRHPLVPRRGTADRRALRADRDVWSDDLQPAR